MTNTETKRSIIEQIHHEFNTASDLALAEAKGILDGINSDSHLIKLHELGFENAKGVLSHVTKKGTMAEQRKVYDTIIRYRVKYPKYKYITELDVQKICKKYNLACAPVNCYHGDVPAKNVEDIAEFVHAYGNEISLERITNIDYKYASIHGDRIDAFKQGWLSKQDKSTMTQSSLRLALSDYNVKADFAVKTVRFKDALYICAPKKDLNLKGLLQIGNIFSRMINNTIKETYEDPIVLCAIPDGYLIVTAWGDEASDPMVVNPQNN